MLVFLSPMALERGCLVGLIASGKVFRIEFVGEVSAELAAQMSDEEIGQAILNGFSMTVPLAGMVRRTDVKVGSPGQFGPKLEA